jgi:hypothetical protein
LDDDHDAPARSVAWSRKARDERSDRWALGLDRCSLAASHLGLTLDGPLHAGGGGMWIPSDANSAIIVGLSYANLRHAYEYRTRIGGPPS